jgi:hypothetical protein
MKIAAPRSDHPPGILAKPPQTNLESLPKPIAQVHQLRNYTELLEQIHHDLRTQHPEWIGPDGESPMCELYEARLNETLGPLMRRDTLARSQVATFG